MLRVLVEKILKNYFKNKREAMQFVDNLRIKKKKLIIVRTIF